MGCYFRGRLIGFLEEGDDMVVRYIRIPFMHDIPMDGLIKWRPVSWKE